MSKYLAKVVNSTVVGFKMVGDNCIAQNDEIEINDYRSDLVGSTYQPEAKRFVDSDDKVLFELQQ